MADNTSNPLTHPDVTHEEQDADRRYTHSSAIRSQAQFCVTLLYKEQTMLQDIITAKTSTLAMEIETRNLLIHNRVLIDLTSYADPRITERQTEAAVEYQDVVIEQMTVEINSFKARLEAKNTQIVIQEEIANEARSAELVAECEWRKKIADV